MNEEEKKAIEELKEFIQGPCEICRYCSGAYRLNRKNIIQSLNLIGKLQKENEKLKSNNENDINQKWIEKVKDNIEELKQKYKAERIHSMIPNIDFNTILDLVKKNDLGGE